MVEELVDRVVIELAERDIEWRPGAVELLTACNEAGLPTALVTMSYDRFADAVVKALPRGRFDAVVTGDAVARGKPHPDAYLMAADLLGVDACGDRRDRGLADRGGVGRGGRMPRRGGAQPCRSAPDAGAGRGGVALDLDVAGLKSLVTNVF